MDLPDDDLSVGIPIDPHRRATSISVYKNTWNEFYTWEQNECRRALDCLAISPSAFPHLDSQSGQITDSPGSHMASDFDFDVEASNANFDTDPETFTCEEFDVHENPIRYSTLTCFTLQETWMKAYPRYEMCTPSSRSYLVYEQEHAPFVPYADDLDFPIEKYLEEFSGFGWHTGFLDPDRECIRKRKSYMHYRITCFPF